MAESGHATPIRTPGGGILTMRDLGFLRAAVVSPEVRVGDVAFNAAEIGRALAVAASEHVALALFPEMSLTGYSCGDLFYQTSLRDAALEGLAAVATGTRETGVAAVVGLPMEIDGRLYNCAALLAAGAVVGIVPKTYLPTTGEFYDERWFASGRDTARESVRVGRADVPFGVDLLFRPEGEPRATMAIEICEDLWAPEPPSGAAAVAGAAILLNPSASNELLGKSAYRRDLVRSQSARCIAAYLYAAAGPGESSADVVYSGHSMAAENGTMLVEGERFCFETRMSVVDLDLMRLSNERLRSSSFSAAPHAPRRVVEFALPEPAAAIPADLRRRVADAPFVPSDPAVRAASCREIFTIQATGLARRLRQTGSRHVVIGVSGGLDSTLALLVCAKTFDALGLPRSGIVAVSMPGPGTDKRTRRNGEGLARMVGASLRVVPITKMVRASLRAIGHDVSNEDRVFENDQARIRTEILFNISNERDIDGIVIGTGDLSEMSLGWATYNGDHMSGYAVNCGVPKTLVRYLVEWSADEEFEGAVSRRLRDICATKITPGLLSIRAGVQTQSTEDLVGPYRLHDFFLYHTIRFSYPPRRVFFLALAAFGDEYSPRVVAHWLGEFYRRFFANQYKRDAVPNGPKVGSAALSPRGDWRMPSDAAAALWLGEVAAVVEGIAAAEAVADAPEQG